MKKFVIILFTVLGISFICSTKVQAHVVTECAVADITDVPRHFWKGDESLAGLSKLLDDYYETHDGSELAQYSKYQPKVMYPNTCLSEDEYECLLKIVEAEATGGTVEQKRNVASCVLTRVASQYFPNTIIDVVFEYSGGTYQFSPIGDKRYWTATKTISASTYEAVWLTLTEGLTHDYTFFCTKKSYDKKDKNGNYISWQRLHLTYGFFDGEHVYSK